MKKIVVLVLLLPLFSALDVQRTSVHSITPLFEDNAKYTDVLYGGFATEAAGLTNTSLDLLYVQARLPINIDSFSIEWNTSGSSNLVITGFGKHPSFISRAGGVLTLGATGFEDTVCVKPSLQPVRSLEQETLTKIIIPKNWSIVSIPENQTKKFTTLDYEFTAWTQPDGLYSKFYFKVNKNTTLKEYCADRARAERVLSQGFVILTASRIEAKLVDAAILLSITLALLYGLKYAMRRGA